MGIFSGTIARDAYHLQHFLCLLKGPLLINAFMKLNDLRDLIAYRHNRIQRCHGILENHGYLLSPDLLHFFFSIFEYIFSFQRNTAACNLSRRIRNQTKDREGRRRLSRSGTGHQKTVVVIRDYRAALCLIQLYFGVNLF